MGSQPCWSARANPPSAYAPRATMATLAILGPLLMTASAQGMPGDDDDSGRSSWAADIRGITPFKAVDREVQPNIMDVHIGGGSLTSFRTYMPTPTVRVLRMVHG